MSNPKEQPYWEPSITFANMRGDVTISWDEKSREFIINMIKEKLSQGYSFFIIEKQTSFGKVVNRKRTLTLNNIDMKAKATGEVFMIDPEEVVLKEPKHIALDDKVLEEGLVKKVIRLVKSKKQKEITTRKRSADPEEIIQSKSIAIKPIHAG